MEEDRAAAQAAERAKQEAADRDSLVWWPLVLVVLVFFAGVGLVLLRHWRRGSVLMGGALVLGAFLRLVLPLRVSGLLAVRSKATDVALLTGMGVGMMVLGMIVPGTYI